MEIGLYSFAEGGPDVTTGRVVDPAERLRDLLEEVELADQVGLDVFGVGEHHRPDYVVSAPAVVLAAAAARTTRIRLTSAVTVLSSDDPVRVFQEFSTVDLISGGRAEIMAGRGSFIESFPLFGYELDDYDELFAEKLDLLLALRSGERVTWSGQHRAALRDASVFPRPVQQPLPVWIAVGGTPQSVVRAATLYRDSARRAGHDPATLPVGINAHVYVADTSQRAADEFYPPYAERMSRIGRERGWPPVTRQQFEGSRSPRGALAVGSPQEVIDKILFQHELFGHQRFLAQLTVGPMPHAQVMHAIELLGTVVAPAVRAAVAAAPSSRARRRLDVSASMTAQVPIAVATRIVSSTSKVPSFERLENSLCSTPVISAAAIPPNTSSAAITYNVKPRRSSRRLPTSSAPPAAARTMSWMPLPNSMSAVSVASTVSESRMRDDWS